MIELLPSTGPRRRTRRSVACHLFPESTPERAVARLREWIDYDPRLRSRLRAAGYHSRCRFLTGRQVEIIRYYFS